MDNFISYPAVYFGLLALLACTGAYLASRGRLSLLTWVLVLVCIVPIQLFAEQYHLRSGQREAKLHTIRDLNSAAHRLTGLLNSHLAAVEGLVAYIATKPHLSTDEFERFAAHIFPQHPHLINVAAAPDLVIRMIYPMAGNEPALGLDYRMHASQRDAVLRARDTGRAVLAGPLDLVQGGRAIIGRLPVFTQDAAGEHKFWGIVSATIDSEQIFAAAGLNNSERFDISLRGVNGTGREGKAFFGPGSESLDPQQATVATTIPVAGGSWEMTAHYSNLEGLERGAWFLRTIALAMLTGWLIVLEQRKRTRDNKQSYERRIRAGERLLQEAGKLAGVGGWRMHANNGHIDFSDEVSKLVGLSYRDKVESKDVLGLIEPCYRRSLERAVRKSLTTGRGFDIELRLARGLVKQWLRIIGSPERENGRIVAVAGAIQDITERKEFIQTIEAQATRDSLTGLPNRAQFEKFLEHELAQSKRRDDKLAVLFIDLDEFKSINDNLGHSGGDTLLSEVAARIQACTRESDVVARLSGDEFAVILSSIETPNDAAIVAAKIVAAINQPFDIHGRQIFTSASVGVAVHPEDGTSSETLVINADQAMYEVKKSMRNDFTFFTRELQQRSEERHSLFNQLSLAVAEERLEVHFQPIIPLNEKGKIACEALVRWQEDGKYVPPDAFVPLAEETGLITEIDRFVMRRAIDQMEALQAVGLPAPALSVNVSPRIFFDRAGELGRWTEHVKACAARTDLTIEITERLLTQDTPHATVVLQELQDAGVRVAIDDFGTGYSSLSYLAKFPIDTLKIDAFFVSQIPHDQSSVTLTETILGLGQDLGLRTVAEGVETAEQVRFLKELGCDSVQGFLFSKPLDSAAFTRWLAQFYESERRRQGGEGNVARLW